MQNQAAEKLISIAHEASALAKSAWLRLSTRRVEALSSTSLVRRVNAYLIVSPVDRDTPSRRHGIQ
eukprot:scaffold129584_cov35-Prasinocladus_malaysianus.AAC.1